MTFTNTLESFKFYISGEKKCSDPEFSDLKALVPSLKRSIFISMTLAGTHSCQKWFCGCHRVNKFSCDGHLRKAALHHVARLQNLEKLRIDTNHLWSRPLPETATPRNPTHKGVRANLQRPVTTTRSYCQSAPLPSSSISRPPTEEIKKKERKNQMALNPRRAAHSRSTSFECG
ncbi:hypothetical protein PAXRUDRAFT_710493 [Paxillus rubicundulus Ve08.2h10]|uniref:Uncharacterized protein n=1 Tax=Paxillus rubicundulus Ve08.2h10 TaxID=930991 RepID=A0A0D0DL80_9AGAM|nr:hypothetical protein PAXRUDRAFT_710493 [Paxillus rubicundulus Ve08.2h10]